MSIPAQQSIAAIILAAGASTRFGANKLLQPFGDGCVISHLLRQVAASACAPVILVTGHERERVEAAIPKTLREKIVTAPNARYAQGEMISSVKTGIAALGACPAPNAALIIPGDMPLLAAAMLQAVMSAYDPRQCDIVAPVFQGRRGHPVLFARALWPELLALRPDQNPRHVVAARRDRLRHIELHTDAILLDVDTPEKWEKAKKRFENGRE